MQLTRHDPKGTTCLKSERKRKKSGYNLRLNVLYGTNITKLSVMHRYRITRSPYLLIWFQTIS